MRQARSKNCWEGNPACKVTVEYMERGPPHVIVRYVDDDVKVYDFAEFGDARRVESEIELKKRNITMNAMLKDDEWDDEATHAGLDDYVAQMAKEAAEKYPPHVLEALNRVEDSNTKD
jgi:predicted HTH domain antitoxin